MTKTIHITVYHSKYDMDNAKDGQKLNLSINVQIQSLKNFDLDEFATNVVRAYLNSANINYREFSITTDLNDAP